MKSIDGLSRRVQRLEGNRAAESASAAATLELEDGAAHRVILEQLQAPGWPAWPPEADGWHHAWVREHWTLEAADAFDFACVALRDIDSAVMTVFATELAAGVPLADACAAARLDPPPPDFAGSPREYIATAWPGYLRIFDIHWRLYERPGAAPSERDRTRAREARERAERIYREPTDAEVGRLLERRGIGIRGEGADWRLYTMGDPLSGR